MVNDDLRQVVHKLGRVDQSEERLQVSAHADPQLRDVQPKHEFSPVLYRFAIEVRLDQQAGVHG